MIMRVKSYIELLPVVTCCAKRNLHVATHTHTHITAGSSGQYSYGNTHVFPGEFA